MKTLRTMLSALTMASLATLAQAGTVAIDPAVKVVNPADSFQVKVLGVGFAETIVGGGFNLAFNAGVLQLIGVTIVPAWEFLPSPGTAGVGSVTNASFNSFRAPKTGSFDIAVLDFKVLTFGSSALALSPSAIFVFSDTASNAVTPNWSAGLVTVVPEPSTALSLLGGVTALALRRRRRD